MAALVYTPAAILSVKDVAAAKRYITDASKSVKGATASHGKATVKAAYATYAALEVGLIVSGKGAQRQPHTITADAYGAMYDNLKGGGVKQSTVNLWINLGMALVRFEVDPESDLWQHLAFKGAGQRKEIRAVLDDSTKTLADLEAAVREFVNPDGTRVTKPAATTPSTTEGDDSDAATTPPEMALKSNLDRARAAAILLAEIVPALTFEEFQQFAPEFQRAYDAARAKREAIKTAEAEAKDAPARAHQRKAGTRKAATARKTA